MQSTVPVVSGVRWLFCSAPQFPRLGGGQQSTAYHIKLPHDRVAYTPTTGMLSSALTGNGHVTLLLLSLRVGEEQYNLFPGPGAKNAQVLTDALFATSFRSGRFDPGCENDGLTENGFLKMYTI